MLETPACISYELIGAKQMVNLNERICAHCKNVFSLIYTNKSGYKSKLNTIYCSKSCAGKVMKPCIGKEALKQKALDFIGNKNQYCTKEEICNGIGHSCKTLTKHGLKISEFNNELGFHKKKSEFQEKVGEVLKKKFSNIEIEKKFDGLVGDTGYPLKVDFYIPSINTVVEADGAQHKNPKHPWNIRDTGDIQRYDKIKDQFLKEKGIKVSRIPYKRNLKESDVLSRLD